MHELTDGQRLRELRAIRGKNMRQIAGLAGISASYYGRLERDEQPLNSRSTICALAAAFEVAPSALTGQPSQSTDPAMAEAQATLPALRVALVTTEFGKPAEGARRPVRQLVTETQQAIGYRTDCDFAALGRILPSLVTGLHTAVVQERGEERVEAMQALIHTLVSASALMHAFSYSMEAYTASDRAVQVATELGDGWTAVAKFSLAHALLPMGNDAMAHAYRIASESADVARSLTGRIEGDPAIAAYGSLCLVSALTAAVTGRAAEADERLAAAAEVAKRAGDCSPTVATFGPTNVLLYQASTALERGDYEESIRFGDSVNLAAITNPERAAKFCIDRGRALAEVRGREADAVAEFRKGEALAPLRVRSNNFARATVTGLLNRVRREAVSHDLRGLAYRMGMTA
ncbi:MULTISPECIES: helix-turn-helix transcriptional regulator [unclassified Crossiella]|uniref:helix-turn-helix domain-containing protein n=1 Tax=unclassified Crossiella TaxID=2620835 RepID=UPI001FFF10AB|nr:MULTISPECIES: helix-turn-helix transcriptional regulator [unclassified Crossiella]MCK2242129.1 helix-turn-helix domain-containing protein [Crossiella sp. S99.2]MCK2256032.1 helix-turn-helix domain-containing protein [Crossiella sp. S99.1]